MARHSPKSGGVLRSGDFPSRLRPAWLASRSAHRLFSVCLFMALVLVVYSVLHLTCYAGKPVTQEQKTAQSQDPAKQSPPPGEQANPAPQPKMKKLYVLPLVGANEGIISTDIYGSKSVNIGRSLYMELLGELAKRQLKQAGYLLEVGFPSNITQKVSGNYSLILEQPSLVQGNPNSVFLAGSYSVQTHNSLEMPVEISANIMAIDGNVGEVIDNIKGQKMIVRARKPNVHQLAEELSVEISVKLPWAN